MNHYLKLLCHAGILIICLLSLSGCGQKGDLYLPNIPPAPVVSGEQMNQVGVSGPSVSSADVSNKDLAEETPIENKESKLNKEK